MTSISTPSPARSTQQKRPAWSLQLRGARDARVQTRQGWSRYERFSILIVLLLSGLMVAVTGGLHFYNYNLETRSSSTSGSHSDFYKETPPKAE